MYDTSIITIGNTGDLAYIDSIKAGLVPCKVISIAGRDVTVRVTADRYGYDRGAVVTLYCLQVIPRGAVHRRRYTTTIGPYQWQGQAFGSPDHVTTWNASHPR